jgi:uncharacterized protein (DUF697 family)
MALPVSFGDVRGLLKELEVSTRGEAWVAVGGARGLVEVLRRELLARGGDAAAVRAGEPDGAAVYVHVVAGGDADEEALKRARRSRVPIVAVVSGAAAEDVALPFVLATDVVRVPPGAGFPVDEIAEVIAARLDEEGAALAARLPTLRAAVCGRLIASFSRKNGIVGAAVFVQGADLPILTLNELRLVLRIAQAYGQGVGRERLPELAASVGAGLGFRALARELLDLLPIAGWAVKGAVAYTGTRALGEAAVRRFELAEAASAVGQAAGSRPEG